MKLNLIPANPKILLYGYGLEGKSSEAWAQRNLAPSLVEIFQDEAGEKPNWESFDLIIKSPGVPPSAVPEHVWSKVTSNLRLFLENLSEQDRSKVIGITGSKGKSTTAKFTHQLLQTAGFKSTIIGNFGVPALDIYQSVNDLDFIVAECSSFQLYDLTVSPKYAIFLSFFPDHLDWHNASEMDYFKAKENLWAHQVEDDLLIVPDSLPATIGMALTYGEANQRQNPIVFSEPVDSDFFPIDSNLQALHFRQNLGTVWALAEQLEIQNLESVWKETAAQFEPIEHRLEKVRDFNGFSFINDSIATSPDATEAGVAWLNENLRVLILDGADTGVGDFDDLVATLLNDSPDALIILLSSPIADKFLAVPDSKKLKIAQVENYDDALEITLAKAKPGAVLFSPAGKSFNRFDNYAQRGKFFKKLVLAL
ncbi:UDP-N-acetylmuramoyl-L-alanine--D-glutamate ligase [bacterium]|nr:UDP-N-acetylmuramoyl-L-alanine--D-glutamate ligase [bacterium]NCQ55088.1 UDP-N-acetylmuramoyl-L-alanine--D-glutamate ligase [Candidatus Parcubacteria bacterium]NCS67132.1 UDP-N-acetylmuramoyl-L-alanine--D-glutamate ligase [Candidatus Peregrinibacteria bacterium]NCS96078.1 UDP-N-acetylmuramoyl-L-alanine--D-glutamate ligase [bacterium]